MTEVPTTRFAPSPTGELHVGGARTAIFAWAYARGRGGRFLLRIEDTDAARSRPEYVERILEALAWLGLDYDGEVVFQSKRWEEGAYDRAFEALEAAGRAYRCYCTSEELEARRAATESFRYDGRCRDLDAATRARFEEEGRPWVLRLAMPRTGEVVVEDALRGEVRFDRAELDDLVIRKADGRPTFHLAVAFDDAESGVTDVIRGDDHLANTPKQVEILAALREATGDDRYRPPRYAHLPLILGPDGKRFSKRHGATSVQAFRDKGILPEALFNYLALLGWSKGDDVERFTREEMIRAFSLQRCGKRSAVFDEEKLIWLNGRYLADADEDRLLRLLAEHLGRKGVRATLVPDADRLAAWGVEGLTGEEWARRVLAQLKVRVRLLGDLYESGRFFWEDEVEIDPEAAEKHFRGERLVERMEAVDEVLAKAPWAPEALEHEIRSAAARGGWGAGKVMHPARVAITGRAVSPGFFETVYLVGRTRARARLAKVITEFRATSGG